MTQGPTPTAPSELLGSDEQTRLVNAAYRSELTAETARAGISPERVMLTRVHCPAFAARLRLARDWVAEQIAERLQREALSEAAGRQVEQLRKQLTRQRPPDAWARPKGAKAAAAATSSPSSRTGTLGHPSAGPPDLSDAFDPSTFLDEDMWNPSGDELHAVVRELGLAGPAPVAVPPRPARE